jgi:hypothetical protein
LHINKTTSLVSITNTLPPVLSGVRISQSLVFYVVFYRSLFILLTITSILWKKGLKYKICISAIKEIHWRNDSKWILLHRIICREDSIKQWVVVFYKEMLIVYSFDHCIVCPSVDTPLVYSRASLYKIQRLTVLLNLLCR